MGDYIPREAAADVLRKAIWDNTPFGPTMMDCLDKIVFDIPAADVRPVVRGEWETIPQEIEMTSWDKRCSICNAKAQIEHNFCPNCGADMRGENNE